MAAQFQDRSLSADADADITRRHVVSVTCTKTKYANLELSSDTASREVAPPPTVNTLFSKTKRCRFFGLGICTKGDACSYAHNSEELRSAPNFFRTKICPTVVNGGVCNSRTCKFAHTREERRKLVCSTRRKEVEMMPAVGKYECEDVAPPKASTYSTQLGDEVVGPLQVSAAEPKVPVMVASDSSACQGLDSPPKRVRPRGCRGGKRRSFGKLEEISDVAEKVSAEVNSRDETSSDFKISEELLYKTRICKFYQESRCLKGDSCQFAHGEVDLKPLPDLRFTKVCPTLASGGECKQPDCRYAHDSRDLRVHCGLRHENSTKDVGSFGRSVFDFYRETTPSTDEGDMSDASDLSECGESEDSSTHIFNAPSHDSPSRCPSPPSWDLDDEVVEATLIVQKTFFTLEELQPPLQQRLRRVHSSPALGMVAEVLPSQPVQHCRRDVRSKTTWPWRSDDVNASSATWLGGVGGA